MTEHTAETGDSIAPADLLAPVLQRAESLMDRVIPETHDRPTPCEAWNVEQLAAHMFADLVNFRVRAEGGTPDWTRAATVPEQPRTDFHEGAEGLLAAWLAHAPHPGDAVEGQTLAEFCLHTWDLERALGADSEVPHDAVVVAERWMRGALKPEYRGSGFAPEIAVPPDASAMERLVAWSGRDPAWRS